MNNIYIDENGVPHMPSQPSGQTKMEPIESTPAAQFEGWAILEIFGHQKYAGYVSTQTFGPAVMFRLDVPALEEREKITERPSYSGMTYVPAGSTVKLEAVQGYTKLFGVGAIYCMSPCTKETALAAVESIQERPLMVIKLAEKPARQLPGPVVEDPDSDEIDDQA